eukprot:717953_1
MSPPMTATQAPPLTPTMEYLGDNFFVDPVTMQHYMQMGPPPPPVTPQFESMNHMAHFNQIPMHNLVPCSVPGPPQMQMPCSPQLMPMHQGQEMYIPDAQQPPIIYA